MMRLGVPDSCRCSNITYIMDLVTNGVGVSVIVIFNNPYRYYDQKILSSMSEWTPLLVTTILYTPSEYDNIYNRCLLFKWHIMIFEMWNFRKPCVILHYFYTVRHKIYFTCVFVSKKKTCMDLDSNGCR